MTTKKQTPQPRAENFPRKAVQVQEGETEIETGRNYAALLTSPALVAFRVINGVELKSGLGEQLDVPTLMAELRDQAAVVNGGNLAQAEAMLMNQATALQSLFSRLAERGMGCDTTEPFEANMRMALRAQAECRATLETLAAIKNPPVVFARQANIANGPQQVNNGAAVPSCARENEVSQSQLSGGGTELLPNAGTPGLAGRANQEVEAVGAFERAKDAGR